MPRFILLFTLLLIFGKFFPAQNQTSQSSAEQIRRREIRLDFLADVEVVSESAATVSARKIALQAGSAQATITTAEISAPFPDATPFLAIAPLIEYSGSDKDIIVSYRTYKLQQNWSEWEKIQIDHDVTAQNTNKLTTLLILDKKTEKIQFKITLTKNTSQLSPTINSFKLDFISPGATPTNWHPADHKLPDEKSDSPESVSAKYPKPMIVSRTGWGCPDGQGNPRGAPSYTTVTHLIVHHTATGNTATDWPAVVRSIWEYHIFTNGWSDIGYNYLIDPNGLIYEGRGGGDNVLGAHFSCQNSGTMGVSMLGTFTTVMPSQVAQNSLREILSWKADQRAINPLGNTFHNGMQSPLANISGHRDGNGLAKSCTTTECPGDSLYPLLPMLRTEVNNLVNPVNDYLLTTNTPKQVIAKTGSATFVISSSVISGTNQTINLSLQNKPTDTNFAFTSTTITAGNATQLLIQIPVTTPSGTYTFQVIGTGATKRSLDLSLVVAGTVASVSAANYLPSSPVAPESIIAGFGANMASETKTATDINLPTTLGNVTVKIKDTLGVELAAPLFYVSPSQINYQIPANLAYGLATVSVYNGSEIVALGELQLSRTAAGIFSANSDGNGVAAAVLQRRQTDGSDSFEQIARYDEAQKIFVPNQLDLSNPGEEVFLSLFGTGFRNLAQDAEVTAKIGETPVAILYVGKQPNFVGLDQVNLQIPRTLANRGLQNILINFAGQSANPVTIYFK